MTIIKIYCLIVFCGSLFLEFFNDKYWKRIVEIFIAWLTLSILVVIKELGYWKMKVYELLKEIEELKKLYGDYKVEELEIKIYDSYNSIEFKPTSI